MRSWILIPSLVLAFTALATPADEPVPYPVFGRLPAILPDSKQVQPVPPPTAVIVPAKLPPIEPLTPQKLPLPAMKELTPFELPPANLKPFDLEHFPRPVATLFAVRPAALLRSPQLIDEGVQNGLEKMIGALITFFGGDPQAVKKWPRMQDLDQILADASFNLRLTEGDNGSAKVGFQTKSCGLIQTREEFDWKQLILAAFPKATATEHAGFTYWRTPIPIGEAKSYLCFHFPNSKTLVIDTDEDGMKTCLNRLKKREKFPTPPGWEFVAGHDVAVVQTADPQDWLAFPPKSQWPTTQAILRIAVRTEAIAVGVSMNPRQNRAEVAITCKNDKVAPKVTEELKYLLKAASESKEQMAEVIELVKLTEVKQEGKVIRAAAASKEKQPWPIFSSGSR